MENSEFIKFVTTSFGMEADADNRCQGEVDGRKVEIDFEENFDSFSAHIFVDDYMYEIDKKKNGDFVLSDDYDDFLNGPVFYEPAALEECLTKIKNENGI